MKIISPKFDFCMKELFRHTEIVKYFLCDMLDIPAEEIHSIELKNTFLWKRYRNHKQGILDVLLEMNNNTKINIELQIKVIKHWDSRELFYAGKLLTDDLWVGADYSNIKRCIMISILDFNFTENEEYHHIYRLMNSQGEVFSDLLEIHILELNKKLKGNKPENNWINLFNAESEVDLNMIQTKNPGLLEAIEEVRKMSLTGMLRVMYEARLKEKRDQRARDAYVREEGKELERQRMSQLLQKMHDNGEDSLMPQLTDIHFLEEMYKKYGL